MHTYIMSFQRVCCWFAGAIDLGVLSGVEPCADVIVSAAAHQSTLVGGGAPAGPKIGAAARWLNCNIYRRPRRGGEAARRRRGGAAGRCGYATAAAGRRAARRPQKISEKFRSILQISHDP